MLYILTKSTNNISLLIKINALHVSSLPQPNKLHMKLWTKVNENSDHACKSECFPWLWKLSKPWSNYGRDFHHHRETFLMRRRKNSNEVTRTYALIHTHSLTHTCSHAITTHSLTHTYIQCSLSPLSYKLSLIHTTTQTRTHTHYSHNLLHSFSYTNIPALTHTIHTLSLSLSLSHTHTPHKKIKEETGDTWKTKIFCIIKNRSSERRGLQRFHSCHLKLGLWKKTQIES